MVNAQITLNITTRFRFFQLGADTDTLGESTQPVTDSSEVMIPEKQAIDTDQRIHLSNTELQDDFTQSHPHSDHITLKSRVRLVPVLQYLVLLPKK